MARIRTVKPAFFRHVELFEAEKATGLPLRVSFVGLWTAADREGRFAWIPQALKLDCLPYDAIDFGLVLDALDAGGFITKYRVGNKVYGHIPSWLDHQVINQREAKSTIPAPSEGEAVPAHARTCTPVQVRGEGKGREGEGKGMDGDARASSVVAGATPAVLVPNLFLQFIEAYPKRDGANPREPARRKFTALLRAGENPDVIISAVKAYAAHLRSRGHEGTQFVAQAITWLDESRWQDYTPRPEDAEQQLATDQMMAAKGLVWADGRWQQKEGLMPA